MKYIYTNTAAKKRKDLLGNVAYQSQKSMHVTDIEETKSSN